MVGKGQTIEQQGSVAVAADRPRMPRVLRRLRRDPVLIVSVLVIVLVILAAILAPLLAPFSPTATDLNAVYASPNGTHLLGTDNVGRDVLSRLIYGARISLAVGLIAVALGAVVGVPLGILAGLVGGVFDDIVMRVADAILAFPAILLAVAITAALGPGIFNAMVAIGVLLMPTYARLVRSVTLATKELDFVNAARVLGASPVRLMVFHIGPATVPTLIVQASLHIAFAILIEASLSFLGLGVQPPTASWGSMIGTAYPQLRLAPWAAISPGVVISLVVLAFNLIGDGLRELIDPLLRRAS